MKESRKPSGGVWRRLAKALAVAALVLVSLVVLLAAALPFVAPLVPLPELELDLAPRLQGKAAELFQRKKATARITLRRAGLSKMTVLAEGDVLDWRYFATANVRFGWLGAKGDLYVSIPGTDLELRGEFDYRSAKDWSFSARVPETRFAHDDAVLGEVLPRLGIAAVSNLVCSGVFSLEANGSSTPRRPVPSWSVRAAVKEVEASALAAGGRPVEVHGLRARFGVDGIADHRDIAPINPRADSVAAAGVVLSNVYASVRAEERSYLVTEAGADACGGRLRLYSLFLDPKRLSAGATVFVDDVDAGKALSHLSCFHGDASGRLHGKLPFFLKDGRTLRLRDAYLFSKPGETGKVRVVDASPILDNLELGGVPKAQRDNLAKALADLDYKVLKVELRRGADNEDSALQLKLEGTATEGSVTVPVVLDVTFHGDFDRLVDTGMNLTRRKMK